MRKLVFLLLFSVTFAYSNKFGYNSQRVTEVKIDRETAIKTSLKEFANTQFKSISLEYIDGKAVYEVNLWRDNASIKLIIDANSGDILAYEEVEANFEYSMSYSKKIKSGIISKNDAIRIALSLSKEGHLYRIDLIEINKRLYYDAYIVERKKCRSIKIDAITGESIQNITGECKL